MEEELQKLKKVHGSWIAVANHLGITYRTICYIRSGHKQPSLALQKLINLSAKQIKTKCEKQRRKHEH